jgi:UDP-N-acetyl-D-mannosaminuronic acid dehydrogenase
MLGRSKNILIVGGGFVGLTLAAKLLKSKKICITVLENNNQKILNFKRGKYGVFEPGLDRLLSKAYFSGKLKFLELLDKDYFDAVFVCIGTPRSQGINYERNQFKIIYESIKNNLKIDSILFLRSTVEIGTTKSLKNFVKLSGRTDIKVLFAPERTAEGVALLELDTLPQILGSAEISDLKYGFDFMVQLGFNVIKTSSSDAAEFIKLMCNVWRDTIFGVANEFAFLSESIGLNIWELIEKANKNYPRAVIPVPGPVNGPCLSKDTYILINHKEFPNSDNSLLLKARTINEQVEIRAYEKMMDYISTNSSQNRTLFLGSAFKGSPKTNDTRQSLTTNLLNRLISENQKIEIKIWDPSIFNEDASELSNYYLNKLEIIEYDIIIFGNNSQIFTQESFLNKLKKLPQSSIIIDMWGIIQNHKDYSAQIYSFGNGQIL